MLRFEPVGNGARPPWWRTVVYVLPTVFLTMSAVVFSPLGWRMSMPSPAGSVVFGAMLALLVSLALPFILFWRHRFPFVVTLVAAGASVVLPLGSSLALLALGTLVGRRRGPAVWWTTGLVAITCAGVAVADVTAQPRGASFWKTILGPQGGDPALPLMAPGVEVAVVVIVGLGVAIGSGLLVRSRREAESAHQAVHQERATSERLGDEVARRQERERIAREVHDAMGHRLSLLNLHAGALEANAGDDPRMAQSAGLVRQSAGAAMDDLRSLLDLLHEPLDSELPPVPLSELARVVDEAFGAGQQISSSIFIQDPDDAAPALTRGVYRIVQEVLTNARKHAPGQQVFLAVHGSPATGVTVDARNRYVGGWAGEPGRSSRGLAGIRERAEVLGGTMTFGLDGEVFRVHVELPWRTT